MRKLSTLGLRVGIIAVLLATIALSIAWSSGSIAIAEARHHSQAERDEFRSLGLPMGENMYFKASGNCAGCHGHDEQGFGMVTDQGVDVNVVDDWRSTMMANSAHDPFWKAKVSHEIQVNPAHQAQLEDKCSSCHAPSGRHDKHLQGLGYYSMAELANDPLGKDGVSCVPCHIQSNDSIGLRFSGQLKFDTTLDVDGARPLYGPYDSVFASPMSSFVGYTPQLGAQITNAGLCAGCHTLATETADLNGNLTGGEFFEQATYHEWLNSDFNNNDNVNGITCQGCHVPRIQSGVVLSANYLFLLPKSPFGLHHFAGANTFMLKMLNDDANALGVSADSIQFDSTIMRTKRMLQQNSLLVHTSVSDRTSDTAFIDVKITNLAGHKFPSGYPSRRAWVELITTNALGDTLFHSGGWNGTYEVHGHPATWEQHWNMINTSQQAQIYEMVMADVNGDKTTTLERAATKLKDNRLPPAGFTTAHYAYDTATIANVPASDIDFNHDDLGIEGSGSDIVHYHVPMGGYGGMMNVFAKVWYQSAPPKWMEEMFAYNSAEIDTFKTYYQNADNSPVLVREDSLNDLSLAIDNLEELGVRIFPNPVHDGLLTVLGIDARVASVEVYDMAGKLIAQRGADTQRQWRLRLPPEAATYIVAVRTRDRVFTQRIVSF